MMTEPITMGYDLSGNRIGSSFTRPSIHPLALTSSLNVYGKFDQPKFTFLGTENKVRNTLGLAGQVVVGSELTQNLDGIRVQSISSYIIITIYGLPNREL